MLAHYYQSLKNFPLRVKQHIHSVEMFVSDYVMTWNYAIPSVENTKKKIYPSTTLLNQFTSTYYDDKDDYFSIFSQQYTDGSF